MDGLADLRRSRGFSQRALANAAGVSASTIYELERGRHSAHPSTAKKLANAMGVEVAEVLGALEAPKGPAPPEEQFSEERRIEFSDDSWSRYLHQFANRYEAGVNEIISRWEQQLILREDEIIGDLGRIGELMDSAAELVRFLGRVLLPRMLGRLKTIQPEAEDLEELEARIDASEALGTAEAEVKTLDTLPLHRRGRELRQRIDTAERLYEELARVEATQRRIFKLIVSDALPRAANELLARTELAQELREALQDFVAQIEKRQSTLQFALSEGGA